MAFNGMKWNNADSWIIQWYQLGQDQDYPLPNFSANTADPTGLCYPAALFSPTCVTNQYVNVQADHAKVARNVSREAITLLKNVNNALPLSTGASLKIFGSDAENNPAGPNACNQRSCNTGILGMGWGSGKFPLFLRSLGFSDRS
jgi:beta-glucosidase